MATESEQTMAELLGQRIATERNQQHLSQQQLAADICAQSMISSLEKGRYIPNAVLLAKICTKLHISMDRIMLSHYPEVNALASFNVMIKTLCDQHDYAGMLTYLATDGLVDRLFTDQDLQTYYYYQAIAMEQALHATQASLRDLHLAYQYTHPTQKTLMTPTEILILASIAFLETKPTQPVATIESGWAHFELALTALEQQPVTQYDENLNSLYYLFALRLHQSQSDSKAIAMIDQGIEWITNHHSHYMLVDLFFLLAQLYTANQQSPEAQRALNQSQTLSTIFKTTPYHDLEC
ncbi:helix-turn-helix domain-containing protein [Latilactobacillus fuchuensis]|uniref:HTH cro/C1-type domain-containing protein n=1 Tax=Latilactobacillus fuchuensis DSM 14340 = JCM 11249 TaxID=1423747 RepID=A0A0R1RSM3_9LACO|nr:helix-turn-helix transcriptional regulator [Latilactobacillus fuchuensis]KRL60151.1 hypothetical protein FC69_GL001354 [Latilactobacillus fuchuensis DSM 14340 = JCM 11249]